MNVLKIIQDLNEDLKAQREYPPLASSIDDALGVHCDAHIVDGYSAISPDGLAALDQLKQFAVDAAADRIALLQAVHDLMRCFVGDRNAQNCIGESGRAADYARSVISNLHYSAQSPHSY
jgi:hypothetical protein